jgi:hypothetical protein
MAFSEADGGCEQIVGNSYIGITSGLPVIHPESLVVVRLISHQESSSGASNRQSAGRSAEHPTRGPLSPRPAMRRALGKPSPAKRMLR